MSDLEESSILSLNLSFKNLVWNISKKRECNLNNLLSVVFNQAVSKQLYKFSMKSNSNTISDKDIFDLRYLINDLINFIENKENMRRVFLNNDLKIMRMQLFDQILNLIFKVIQSFIWKLFCLNHSNRLQKPQLISIINLNLKRFLISYHHFLLDHWK